MSVILNEPGIRALFFGTEMNVYLERKVHEVAASINGDFGMILWRLPEGNRPHAEGHVAPGEASLVGTVSWDTSHRAGRDMVEKSKREPDKLVGGAMVAAGFQRV